MVFSSLSFLYVFLPLVLGVYFLTAWFFPQGKNFILLVFSLAFYAIGEPRYLLLMVGTIVFVYAMGRWIGKKRGTPAAGHLLLIGCAVLLASLAFFKYTDFLLRSLGGLLGRELPLLRLALPIGISFYTFQALSYLVDVYRGDMQPLTGWIDLATYIALFPQLIAGPIVRCSDVAEDLRHRRTTAGDAADGVCRFVLGLGKKVLLANQLDMLCTACREEATLSVLSLWVCAIAYALQIYLDFSGYSDMAIGLGKIFGFRFPENFNYPYISQSITEFWRRWHMTLGGWFRDYVYIPLGGNRVPRWKWVRNLLVVWALTGLWHGAGWNFLLWGLWYGLLLAVEKLWLLPVLQKTPRWLRHAYVLLAVVLGFVLFRAETFSAAVADLGGMFVPGVLPLYTPAALYTFASYAGLLLVALTAATPLWKKLVHRLEATPLPALLQAPVLGTVLLLCTAFLVDGSFNPFLYFRF